MENKKLNIQFEENVDDPFYFDNQYDSLNNLGICNEKETLMDVIQQKDYQLNDLKTKISELQMKASLFEEKESLYKDKLKFKDDLIEALKLTIETSKKTNQDNVASESTDRMFNNLFTEREKLNLKSKDEEIAKLKAQIKIKQELINKSVNTIERNVALMKKFEVFRELVMRRDNKIKLEMEYGGTKLSMQVPKLNDFEPVLENTIAGPGSIVIQRRIDGTIDFDRSLSDYYVGFGNRQGEFWLGLERIHKITSHQRHELYIHIVDYDGKTHYAKYDNFVVGSKEEKYVLKSLGNYSGNANDMMRLNEGKLFAVGTKIYKSGWWWLLEVTPSCNLNGKFSEKLIENHEHIFWGHDMWGNKRNFVKSVQMLIRPLKVI